MSPFKPEHFRINDEGKGSSEIRVVKLESGEGPRVTDFALSELVIQGKGNYETLKAKYGVRAATDPDRQPKGQKESRFSMSPLIRDPLAIEQEERRVIETRVRDQVAVVEAEARKTGEKKGYEDGLKKGRDEAYAEFKAKAEASLTSFEAMVKSSESLKSEIFKANERFLMEVIFRVAKQVTLKELSTDQDYVLRLARDLLDRMGIRENVKIRINPKDSASVELLKPELAKSFSDLKNLNIEVSDEVEGGGCKIETQWSAIDASIETQLKGLGEALIGSSETPAT